MNQDTSISNRENLFHFLEGELVGPRPAGERLGETQPTDENDLYRPWRQDDGEEILSVDSPSQRYGAAVLYPTGVPIEQEGSDEGAEGSEPEDSQEQGQREKAEERLKGEIEGFEQKEGRSQEDPADETDDPDFDLSLANAYRPASVGLSCVADLPPDARLVVEVTGGRYGLRTMTAGERSRSWWFRRPLRARVEFDASELVSDHVRTSRRTLDPDDGGPLRLDVEVYSRPYAGPGSNGGTGRLLTIALVNRSEVTERLDAVCLFQTGVAVHVVTRGGGGEFLPYPTADEFGLHDARHRRDTERERPGLQAALEEEESLALLYRNSRTYAIGHGCAADWDTPDENGRVRTVHSTYLPRVELPSMTPDVTRADGSRLEVPMAPLAGLDPNDDGRAALDEVIDEYEGWIRRQQARISALPDRHHEAAERNLTRARTCAVRMRDGLTFLDEDLMAARAFQLANHAILLQQVRGGDIRSAQIERGRLSFEGEPPHPAPSLSELSTKKWRAFQIAFILMSLRSTAEGRDSDRETVELIWFPTGGGKTEAYLGLAAFSIFLRRLRDPEDRGVQVLMRYTLRLLTAQQFQRAARLICAIEHLRREELGAAGEPVRIGIWVGGSSTPNRRTQALRSLRELERKRDAENPFLVRSCPWCNAQMGPHRHGRQTVVLGYRQQSNTVLLHCPDPECAFYEGLPIRVVDEDLYEDRPELIIGTIDKFAMLAWRPEARSLFGLDSEGQRVASPPGLIIQDELHLISGPLGTVAGLFEVVVEELCTDRRPDAPVPPKLVSSTATIRRFEDQVRSLYARERSTLFPPPGLDAEDSFFAQVALRADGSREPGRMYVGVHAPGLGSLQTVQVRTFASLLVWPVTLEAQEGREQSAIRAEQDPYWTLLTFYNSLRELGGALSLFQDDIPAYIGGIRKRIGLNLRRFFGEPYVLELTGRIRGDEVPRAIETLESTREGKQKPVDACLASNIIEVGVDIDRLSLMAVVGQPKTTAQYIQVTGRVGRRWWERPGLVVTLYSASKPRDRSHFETFRTYHERLYAQVEPTSVTPFSPLRWTACFTRRWWPTSGRRATRPVGQIRCLRKISKCSTSC